MDLFLDVETTGLDPDCDEILSLTIIQYDYENNVFRTCFDLKFKPRFHTEWPEAERINGISPADVSNCPPIMDYLKSVQGLVNESSRIYIYNVKFDSAFLEKLGIDFSGKTFVDPMISFANRYSNGKWKSLSYVFSHFIGRNLEDSHTSFGDTLALVELSMALYPQSFRIDALSVFRSYYAKN